MQITRYVPVDANDREDDNRGRPHVWRYSADETVRPWIVSVPGFDAADFDTWQEAFDHALEQARELPGPVVTFGEDCNPDYLLGSLPTGMAVTLHLPDGPVEAMWIGCDKGVVRYKVWPGFEHGLVVNADDLPGQFIETDWIDVSRIEIH